MENQKIKLQIKKDKRGIIGCKIEKVNEKKKDEIMEVDGKPMEADGKPNDVEMESKETKNENQKENGWVEPRTDSESDEEGSNESTTGSEDDGSENEDQLLKGSDEEGKKKESLKEKLAKKRKERQEKEEFKKMMAEMKKMKKEIDEEREKLNEEKKDMERKKKEKQNEAEQQNRMRVDKNALPEGWQWFSEGQNWVDGIFGFLDNNGERLIGMEYNLIKENKLARVKGIWNCIMVINNGRKIFLDGGMMDQKARLFLEGGENARCCGVVSRRGVYKLSRIGKVYGTKGENIFYFKWRPMADSNIGFNVGDMPHIDCRGGRKIVD